MTDSGSSPSPDDACSKLFKSRPKKPDLRLYIPPGGNRPTHCNADAVPRRAASGSACAARRQRRSPAAAVESAAADGSAAMASAATFTNIVHLGERAKNDKMKSIAKKAPKTCASRLLDNASRNTSDNKDSFNRVQMPHKSKPCSNAPDANARKCSGPNPTKLPEEQIAEMLKRYNIGGGGPKNLNCDRESTVSHDETTVSHEEKATVSRDVELRAALGLAGTVGSGSAVDPEPVTVSGYSNPTVSPAAGSRPCFVGDFETSTARSSMCSDLIDFSNDDVFLSLNEFEASLQRSEIGQPQPRPSTSSSSNSPPFYSASTTCTNSASNLSKSTNHGSALFKPTNGGSSSCRSTNQGSILSKPTNRGSTLIKPTNHRRSSALIGQSSKDVDEKRLSIDNGATSANNFGIDQSANDFDEKRLSIDNGATSANNVGIDQSANEFYEKQLSIYGGAPMNSDATLCVSGLDLKKSISIGKDDFGAGSFNIIAGSNKQHQNDADQILSSLPKSYDEFVEVRELNNGSPPAQQQRALSGSYALVEIPTAASSSPSNVDPDDLEVQQINESFEEQLKQAQVLSNSKIKEAFYKQPNRIDHVSSGGVSSSVDATIPQPTVALTTIAPAAVILATVPSVLYSRRPEILQLADHQFAAYCSQTAMTTTSNIKPFGDNNLIAIQRHTVDQAPPTSVNIDATRGLTWAGWGSNVKATSPRVSTNDSGSDATPFETALASPKSIDNSSLLTNPDLDSLSKEMIDKVLLDDDEEEVGGDNFRDDNNEASPNETDYCSRDAVCAGRTVVAADAVSCRAATVTRRSGDDDNARVIAADNPPMTSSLSAVVDEWEDLVEADFVPVFKPAANKAEDEPAPPIDYLQFNFKRGVQIPADEFGHVLEAYGFTPSVRAEQLHAAMRQLDCKHYNLEWVDDNHALVVLTDPNVAFQALQCYNPVIKLRPLHQASAQSRKKAKEFAAQLRPYKPKPETNAFLARKLVEGHLGKRCQISDNLRHRELAQLQTAKESKRIAAQLKEDAWEGNI